MKAAFLAISIFVSLPAFANLDFRCTGKSDLTCEARVAAALEKIGCAYDPASVSCSESNEPGAAWCKAVSQNCWEPGAELFGFNADSVTCGYTLKRIRDQDSGLTLTWTMGFIRDYVSLVCVRD